MKKPDTGKFIKDARKRMNLTQEQLAGLIGVPQNYISRYERGKAEPPAYRVLAIMELETRISK